MRKTIALCLAVVALAFPAFATPHPVNFDLSALLPPDSATSDTLTGGSFSPMVSYPITLTINSNGAPVLTGGNPDPPEFIQSTNPIIYSYSTNLVLSSNDLPVLQYILQDNYNGIGRILINCYSNEVCELQEATDLTLGDWSYVREVLNNSIYTFYTTNSPSLFFRLVLVPNRFYVTILPAPDGTPATGVMVFPEWDISYSYYFSVTNISPTNASFTFCALGDELLLPVYPDTETNSSTAWQCAYIMDYYLDETGGEHSAYAEVDMPAGCHYMTFEPNYMFGILDPGEADPDWLTCPSTFPTLYVGTFGCTNGSPTNSPYSGLPGQIIGAGGGSGGNVPPLSGGPIYEPPNLDPVTLNPGPQNMPTITGPGDYPDKYPGDPTGTGTGQFPSMIYPGIPGSHNIPPSPVQLDPKPDPNMPPAGGPCIFDLLYHQATGL